MQTTLKLWVADEPFESDWFTIELEELGLSQFKDPFTRSIKPGLHLLRSADVRLHQLPAGEGIQCIIDSPDAQFLVRLTPRYGVIAVHVLDDLAAAARFCEFVAGVTDAQRWRVHDMVSDTAPPALRRPDHALLFGRVKAQTRSRYQHIVLAEHAIYGDVLVLDGEIQIGARDVEAYSRALVERGLTAATRAVLILGGGDCGVLKEVLRHPIERVVMVELDPEVIAFCQTHMPEACGDALEDPRTELRCEDAFAFIDGCTERFDLVVCDLTGAPIGGVSIDARIERLAHLLTRGGRLVTHADIEDPTGTHDGVPVVAAVRTRFEHIEVRVHSIASFQDCPWLFVCAWGPHEIQGGVPP